MREGSGIFLPPSTWLCPFGLDNKPRLNWSKDRTAQIQGWLKCQPRGRGGGTEVLKGSKGRGVSPGGTPIRKGRGCSSEILN